MTQPAGLRNRRKPINTPAMQRSARNGGDRAAIAPLFLLFALLVQLVAPASVAAAPAAPAVRPVLTVTGAWSRPAVAGTTGVGYMTLANHGNAADALVSIASPAASRVEMHSSSMTGGVMSMEREDKVAVPAGGQVVFGPGAYHVMLIGLKSTLKPGDRAPATLTFASGAHLKVAFTVSSGMGPPAHMGAKAR
jgi:copper(I)-binding protein